MERHPILRENWRRARTALRTGQERLTDQQQQIVTGIRRHRRRLYRAWELKEELRDLYRTVPPDQAGAYLKAWTTRALRCRIPAMHTLAQRLR